MPSELESRYGKWTDELNVGGAKNRNLMAEIAESLIPQLAAQRNIVFATFLSQYISFMSRDMITLKPSKTDLLLSF